MISSPWSILSIRIGGTGVSAATFNLGVLLVVEVILLVPVVVELAVRVAEAVVVEAVVVVAVGDAKSSSGKSSIDSKSGRISCGNAVNSRSKRGGSISDPSSITLMFLYY